MDDYNNSYDYQSPTPPMEPIQQSSPSNGFATTSLIMGICSIVFICCGGGLVLGALGIIFAILSRGGQAMNTQAKVGLGLSIGGFVVSTVLIIGLFAYGDFQRNFTRSFREYYGDNYYDYGQEWDYDYEDLFDQYGDTFNLPDLDDKFGDT